MWLKKILTHLKGQKAALAMLQETKLINVKYLKLKWDWTGQIYFSSQKLNKRDVTIFIHNNVPFILENEEKEPEGRLILLLALFLINYLKCVHPNTDSPHIDPQIILMLNQQCKGLCFLAGDFNRVLIQNHLAFSIIYMKTVALLMFGNNYPQK